jgi:hypothetical protein
MKYNPAFGERRLTRSAYSLLNILKRFQSDFARGFDLCSTCGVSGGHVAAAGENSKQQEVQLGGIQCTLNP